MEEYRKKQHELYKKRNDEKQKIKEYEEQQKLKEYEEQQNKILREKEIFENIQIEKQNKLNEINKIASKITKFIKKKISFKVNNLTNNEIELIEPYNRYRCYIYDSEDLQSLFINYKKNLFETTDPDERSINEIDFQCSFAEMKTNAKKIPVMLNLSSMGSCFEYNIKYNNITYYFDNNTKTNIKKSYNKLYRNSNTLLRYTQHMDYYKEISKAFLNY
jgi:hypothetical protein